MAAKLTAVVVLPTPPLPLSTANTLRGEPLRLVAKAILLFAKRETSPLNQPWPLDSMNISQMRSPQRHAPLNFILCNRVGFALSLLPDESAWDLARQFSIHTDGTRGQGGWLGQVKGNRQSGVRHFSDRRILDMPLAKPGLVVQNLLLPISLQAQRFFGRQIGALHLTI